LGLDESGGVAISARGIYSDGTLYGSNLYLTTPPSVDYGSSIILNPQNTLAFDVSAGGIRSYVYHEFLGSIVGVTASFTGLVSASKGISASGITVGGSISAPNIVNSVNGITGSVGGLNSPVGMTSGSLRVFTYPDGITSTGSKTAFYQPCNLTFQIWNPSFTAYANRTYFTLHNVNRSTNIKTLRFTSNNTVTTGNAYISVWSVDPLTGFPSTRLYVSASTAVGSGYNTTSVTNASGLVTVPAGYFYIAVSFSSSPTVYGMSNNYTLSTYGSGNMTSGYNMAVAVLDSSGFTAPTSITQAGTTFGIVDYSPSSTTGIFTEFGIV
jgi:hypothetical protein